MTPDQISSIISAMPEGKRKEASKHVLGVLNSFPHAEPPGFWDAMADKKYGLACSLLTNFVDNIEPLADMIWEGGA